MYYLTNGIGIAVLLTAILYRSDIRIWKTVLIGIDLAITAVIMGYLIGSGIDLIPL